MRTISIPGSKSYTNRALILAALTKGSVVLERPLYCEDSHAMMGCLQTLGMDIETFSDKLIVHGDVSQIQDKKYELFAQDSGTTLRFILALCALTPGQKILQGNQRLNERPITPLVDALRQLGAKIDSLAPLCISTAMINKKEVFLDASMSSQFVSALLMMTPFLGGVMLHLPRGVISKPYVDMTLAMMKEANVEVIRLEKGYYLPPNQEYKKKKYLIEGDFSTAAYFLAMGALTKTSIRLTSLPQTSLQADKQFISILEKMGNQIVQKEDEVIIHGRGVRPIAVNMEDCPDQVQTLAVLAAFASGVTTLSGIRSLRYKETERVIAVQQELEKMGIKTTSTENELTIYGGSPKAATISTYGDHRMAMAFAVASTKLPDMKISDPHVVNKTCPTFWELLS